MKNKFALFLAQWLALALAASVEAQALPNGGASEPVEILPADFTLFGRTRREYLGEWVQHVIPLSTNGDYLLPKAVASESDLVYFLQRPLFGTPPPGLQTYFVPDDGYVCFPIVFLWGDNVDTFPVFTVEELHDGVAGLVQAMSGVHITLDGILSTNLGDYQTVSPAFSMVFPSSDNWYSVILRHPLEGIVDPVVAGGYLLMLKPLSAGLHDVQLGATLGPPQNFSFERHFQIQSLALPQILARQTEALSASVTSSSLPSNRQRRLLATLKGAAKSFDRGHSRSGIRHLRAFQKKVGHEITRIDPALAEQLIAAAQRIIDRANQNLKKVNSREKPPA